MILPLDGPSAQLAISVTTGSVVEAKAGASTFLERKVVTLQPTNGDLYVYFDAGTGTPPNVLTVQTNGLTIFSGCKETFEASTSQIIYVLAVATTVNLIVVERA